MTVETPCTLILTGTLKPGAEKTPEFQEYSRRSAANGEALGGRLLGKYDIERNIGQGSAPNVVFVVEYPSRKIAIEAFTNAEYQSIIPLRDRAFEEVKILVCAQN